jgi:hypothetical protein
MTKLTKQECIVLAAVLGGSNLGFEKPTRERVQASLVPSGNGYQPTVQDVAYRFWSGYMEDDGAEKAIVGECKWWFNKNLKGEDRESVTKSWPDIASLVW